ncbi:unnamed protein product [Dicrocoelium dendriticum]|nr:unnamed protein product [Dicrocoelium dendriticum]
MDFEPRSTAFVLDRSHIEQLNLSIRTSASLASFPVHSVFAPWCPACRQFSSVWTELSEVPDLNASIAAVDVTESPVLSFVFFVRQLPTLFHAKDGVFRTYNGSRTFTDLKEFLTDASYEKVDPIPWYYSPSAMHMRAFFRFMELGMTITRIHEYLLQAGYPTWASFAIIGSGTVLFGLVLGLVLVFLSDCIVPPRPQILRLFKKPKQPTSQKTTDSLKTPDEHIVTASSALTVDGSGEHQDEQGEVECRKRITASGD